MKSIYINLGNKVRKLRKTKGLSQESLADLIGRDARTVVAIESGKRNPTMKTLNKIAHALGIKLSELFNS